MRMRIDPAGNDELARGVDDDIGLHIERLTDRRDRLAVDKDVGGVVVNGGYNTAVFDKCFHNFVLIYA